MSMIKCIWNFCNDCSYLSLTLYFLDFSNYENVQEVPPQKQSVILKRTFKIAKHSENLLFISITFYFFYLRNNFLITVIYRD